ncbi:uncharacterized protein AMSG_02240 [Thecamonas trahens ATCC 50062]|uniref:RING-type domain-containing protein n=1 Tax=Thecamonas trahens ATCC 50062 TaxID=461836 RepID=A0A0L0DW19_THETB|nr:hypothetical protein AMSG_02240 [Thecamonas trahens ATCC 50062]KNC56271.1 hypothetical protein AMSG_02240 [Thecamonas trahens ATCC 50062]|eukprot:XP_013760790.1 hypothetical protein AMSG_02240 [Thecamonas trahens ATCC 50062]
MEVIANSIDRIREAVSKSPLLLKQHYDELEAIAQQLADLAGRMSTAEKVSNLQDAQPEALHPEVVFEAESSADSESDEHSGAANAVSDTSASALSSSTATSASSVPAVSVVASTRALFEAASVPAPTTPSIKTGRKWKRPAPAPAPAPTTPSIKTGRKWKRPAPAPAPTPTTPSIKTGRKWKRPTPAPVPTPTTPSIKTGRKWKRPTPAPAPAPVALQTKPPPPSLSTTCIVYLQPGQPDPQLKCGHSEICGRCIGEMCATELAGMSRILCPSLECRAPITYKVVSTWLPEDARSHHLDNFNFIVGGGESDSWLWCSNPDCSDAWPVHAATDGVLTCRCTARTCVAHSEPCLPRGTGFCCRVSSGDFASTIDACPSTIKMCPKCDTLIEKNGGCRHMTCVCGHEFFWCCLRPYRQIEAARAHYSDPVCITAEL